MKGITGEAVATVRLEARLRRWFATEVDRADRDLVTTLPPLAAPGGRTRSVTGVAISGAAVTLVLGLGLVAVFASARGFPPSGNGATSAPGLSIKPANVTAWYPDGVPAAINGEKVFRPDAVGADVSTGWLLVGGWDFGPLGVSCPAIISGQSPPWCPVYEGLAAVEGGDRVLDVMWDQPYQNAAPIVVVRVEVIPLPFCTSSPPAGCPERPSVRASGFVWQGSPGP